MSAFATIAFLASAIFAAPVVSVTSAVATDRCVRSEQAGCFELDMMNLQYDSNIPLMKKMVSRSNVDGPIDTDWGPSLFKMLSGSGGRRPRSAGGKTFYVYTWSTACSADRMSEYHLTNSDGTGSLRRSVTEISVGEGPAAWTEYSIGTPSQAFRVDTDRAVAALQFPWDCIDGGQTYILVCTADGVTIFPDRVTASKGILLRPSFLRQIRKWEYILLPHLSL